MTEKELWQYFKDQKVCSTHPFDREFIWVRKADFEQVRDHFKPEFNIFHLAGGSLRSNGYVRHIHAVEDGTYVFVHQDTGNLARFFPLGILHLFFDVLPYLLIFRTSKVERPSILDS